MDRMGRALTATRYVVLFGVVASIALAAILFIVVASRIFAVIGEAFAAVQSEKAVRLLIVASIELVDLSLLAAAIYIVGLGLFELFIGPVRLPQWLVITSLDDLKTRLINVVVVILGVSFLGQVVAWDGTTNLLPFGLAIAAVILALTAFGALQFTAATRRAVFPLGVENTAAPSPATANPTAQEHKSDAPAGDRDEHVAQSTGGANSNE
jgi:uncharacterized membrane protein YqhA